MAEHARGEFVAGLGWSCTNCDTFYCPAVQADPVEVYKRQVEAARVDLLRRLVTPTWKRVGWEPRRWAGAKHTDPIDEAREFTRLDHVDGIVMVPLALLKALVERRECSARHDFTADEDGPHPWVTYATCRIAEGHDGQHSNGYHRWSADA